MHFRLLSGINSIPIASTPTALPPDTQCRPLLDFMPETCLVSLLGCSDGVETCAGIGSNAGFFFCNGGGGGVFSATPGVGFLLLITGEAEPGFEPPLLSCLLWLIVENRFSRSSLTFVISGISDICLQSVLSEFFLI